MSLAEFRRIGHWPTVLCAFLYFSLSCMAWMLIGALGNTLADEFQLSPQQKGLMVATPVLGRLGDGPHRRPVVLTVLGVVVAGGVLAALPLGLGWIIAGRGLQGFALGLTPVAIATARDVLAGERARSVAAAL